MGMLYHVPTRRNLSSGLGGGSVRGSGRGLRVGRALLITVLVLLGLLIAVDRIALAVAERKAGETLQRSQHLATRPGVSIGGFPFLTQLAAGNFDRITTTVHDLTLAQDTGTQLRIGTLHVTLRHVHVTRDLKSARSDFSTATALISYRDLSQTLGVPLSYAGDGRVTASASLAVGGVTAQGTASARIVLQGESLGFADASVGGLSLPAPVVSALNAAFGRTIPLTGLPFGVHVQGLRATTKGIEITLTARGLTYQR